MGGLLAGVDSILGFAGSADCGTCLALMGGLRPGVDSLLDRWGVGARSAAGGFAEDELGFATSGGSAPDLTVSFAAAAGSMVRGGADCSFAGAGRAAVWLSGAAG